MNGDTDTFKALTRSLYAVISAHTRDWSSIRAHYHPDARLVRAGIDDDGAPISRVMTFDEYTASADELLAGVRFTETELKQHSCVFGNVAQLTSVYQYTWANSENTRQGRGVNFISLIRVGQRWQIISIVWDNERDGLTLSDAGLSA